MARGKGSQTDNALQRSVYVGGKKWGGVQNIKLDYDVKNILTQVHLTFVVRRNGIKLSRKKIEIEPLICI